MKHQDKLWLIEFFSVGFAALFAFNFVHGWYMWSSICFVECVMHLIDYCKTAKEYLES